MALAWANVDELKALDNLTGKGTPENLTLKLCKTNVTPRQSSVDWDLTKADCFGYTSVTLATRSSWIKRPAPLRQYGRLGALRTERWNQV